MQVSVAYFSAEFGLSNSLPTYSGGLGILAGDHVKAAGDIGLELTGVGILYRRGYFRQSIGTQGEQHADYPWLEPESRGLQAVVVPGGGEQLRVAVPCGDHSLYLKIWQVVVGNIAVYLMDADIPENRPEERNLTDSLYGGNQATRLQQEIVLGIGGVRVLRAIGLKPRVWHINEGHAALMSLERIREYSALGVSFATALELVKASTVFTTHTPVAAGHDEFTFRLMDAYLNSYYWQLGAQREQILALGTIGDKFNMTRLAVSTAGMVNGVSKIHAGVTQQLMHSWMPHIPVPDIQVGAITNGIHLKTWQAPELVHLLSRYLPDGWQCKPAQRENWAAVSSIPDPELWQCHAQIKYRACRELGLESCQHDLLVGFARRFASYKRALLIFRDLERLERILNNPDSPVSIVLAGKAHPEDRIGQELIRQIVQISRQPRFYSKVYFLPDYDIAMAQALVQGVDVWLNTPRKPLEASGTSGQKAGVNGVLNCSVLDGWWNEGFDEKNGWAIPGGLGSEEEQDRQDSEYLYRLLEEQIVPLYYAANEQGFSPEWVAKMKASIQALAPVYNTQRMVGEYMEKCYYPSAARFDRFAADDNAIAGQVAAFKDFIRRNWSEVQVLRIAVAEHAEQGEQTKLLVQCRLRLGPIWHQDVLVQAVGSNGQGGIWSLDLTMQQRDATGIYLYSGIFAPGLKVWQHANPNVRVVPVSTEFAHTFELELSCWGNL